MRCAFMCGAVAALAMTYGCGDDRRGGADDAGLADASPTDAVAPDAGEPDAGPRSCAARAPLDADLAVDPDGPDTQIHAAAAFDGEGLWVVFNRVETGGTGYFDVYAQRLGCDGEPLLDSPLPINTTVPPNDVDPDLAVSGDRVLVAWSADSGEFPDNLSIRYRVFEVDGTPVMGSDAELVTTWDGGDVTGNHWQVSVAAAPGGGFVIAGARALPDATVFQVFAQAVTAEGAVDGETWYPLLEPDVSQTVPSVTYRDGVPWLAWTREDETTQQVMEAELPAAGDASPAAAVADLSASAGAHQDGAWLALAGIAGGGEQDIHVTGPGEHTLGASGRVDFSPRVETDAEGAAGAAVAWFRNDSGIRNDLLLATVGGDERLLASDVPPYQPALASVGDGVYLLVWSAGTSPDFRLVARFVRP